MPRRNPPTGRERSVFLNIPYDAGFQRLYIAGISAFGLVPRATLEIPTSERRLDRIIALIDECAYSIHDLSRVQLDRKAPITPRFNMPFELGLAVARNSPHGRQRWYVCESLLRSFCLQAPRIRHSICGQRRPLAPCLSEAFGGSKHATTIWFSPGNQHQSAG